MVRALKNWGGFEPTPLPGNHFGEGGLAMDNSMGRTPPGTEILNSRPPCLENQGEKRVNFAIPTKCGNPKSLKFDYWLSKKESLEAVLSKMAPPL